MVIQANRASSRRQQIKRRSHVLIAEVEGMTLTEVAAELGISRQCVQQLVERARVTIGG